jgi:hypothetical protein
MSGNYITVSGMTSLGNHTVRISEQAPPEMRRGNGNKNELED